MKELVLGAGSRRIKWLAQGGEPVYENPVFLDNNPDHQPTILWDLNSRPLPFEDGEFDEIHAYEVLEHIGRQGDWQGFFEEFSEYHRILKPGGFLMGSCPMWNSPWAWGDPSHTRVLSKHSFTFLNQDAYEQVGRTPMSDFRSVWKGDFKLVFAKEAEDNFWWSLQRGN